ncbi:MAG: hypothetical protein [Caudoviricetes sp.]|nr:MAG: hypothetical protein [Caudoviricetes sp.]
MVKVKIEGLEAITKGLKNKKADMQKVSDLVKKHGAGLSDKTQRNMLSQYRGHFEGNKFVKPTGATRRSSVVQIEDNGLTAKVQPGTKYFPYLEYGTRFMAARPTLGPAFRIEAPLFEGDVKKLIEE